MSRVQEAVTTAREISERGLAICRLPESELRDILLSTLRYELEAITGNHYDLFRMQESFATLNEKHWLWTVERCNALLVMLSTRTEREIAELESSRLLASAMLTPRVYPQTEAEIQSTLTSFAERHNATVAVQSSGDSMCPGVLP